METVEQIQKRLNKIAVLIDRHMERIEMQAYYIAILMENPNEDPIHKLALAEAMRLEAYHTKELGRLKEEQEHLYFATSQKERSFD